MFTHIMLGTSDLAKAKQFYDATLGALGTGPAFDLGEQLLYRNDSGALLIGKPANGKPASYANGGTVGFVAPSCEAVDAFHAAGLANGGTCEGEPGPRPQVPGNAYAAYLRDPEGNKICAFHGLEI